MLFDLFTGKKLRKKIKLLEQRIFDLEKKINFYQKINNTNLIRVKNNEYISDQSIMNMNKYLDISAFKAYEQLSSDDAQYFILDVEDENYKRPVTLQPIINIPLHKLEQSIQDLPSKTVPLFVISRDGIKSINACEVLVKNNFYNCCNISGGYEKWPNLKIEGLGQTLDE